MREVLFKDLTSVASRKKDIFLKEVFVKDGVVARTERRCFYLIREMKQLGDDGGLQSWLHSQEDGANTNTRQFHIMKEHNDLLGEDKVICKICGTFFAVINNCVYTIGFLHSFKVAFSKPTLAK